jgi:hypothetical protein
MASSERGVQVGQSVNVDIAEETVVRLLADKQRVFETALNVAVDLTGKELAGPEIKTIMEAIDVIASAIRYSEYGPGAFQCFAENDCRG